MTETNNNLADRNGNQTLIIDYLKSIGTPVTARAIAAALSITKNTVNSILYELENSRVERFNTTPPYWAMMSIKDQIIHCLSEEPITAREIAEKLGVSKNIINSILYSFEGTTAYHDDSIRPNWYLIGATEEE